MIFHNKLIFELRFSKLVIFGEVDIIGLLKFSYFV